MSSASHEGDWTEFIASGGAGVVVEDGTLVFPLMAKDEAEDVCSMIVHSTDSGSAWSLAEDISPAECLNPRVTEWEGSLLMIVDCEDGRRVCESRGMRTAWTEAIGTLSGVWVNARSGVSQKESLRVDFLITATIEEGRKVMLCTQRGHASVKKRATALCLWVTDNNHTFSVGPVAMDKASKWKGEVKDCCMHLDALLSLPCFFSAHGSILRCEIYGVAIACALVYALCRGLLFPMTPPLCGRVEGSGDAWGSEGGRCFRTFA
ncbi:trans-sialidase, putative, partial [Trypanosoma cruzi]